MFKKGGTALDVTVVHETNKPDLLEEECKENVLKYSLLIRALKASDKTVMVVKIHSFPLEGRGKWFMGNEKVMRTRHSRSGKMAQVVLPETCVHRTIQHLCNSHRVDGTRV